MARPVKVPRELTVEPFSGSRAVAAGLITKRMLTGRTWCRLLHDVYIHVDSYHPDDHRMWCRAVATRLPTGAAIYGLSAAYLWGVDLLPQRGRATAPVHVAVPSIARPDPHPRIRYAKLALDHKHDVTPLFGMPVTSGVRTAYDLGRRLPRADALITLDAFLRRRTCTKAQLAAYVDAHPGRRHVNQLRELLSLADPLSASPMESRLRLLLHDAGLPKPTPQYEIRVQRKFIARVDLAYPQWRIAIEYEGDHHREQATFRKDVHRFNALHAAGWLALRFTADDVLRRTAQLTQTVRQAIADRSS
ncbi:endonuclease domain-containing protein [Micromonospora sp. NBC_01813]|uniref:endonuclease domain-containing protein n=1 Tax=Micromonospora sp. NBC_01813 TaxID=2975988 RepID=UPI002DDA1649|nr:DUF559 domain-containing protein [Micromonospora sp. NBC_01813]WSA08133.1 endonuclease domain-containing protein [Micromonospora sp. NBC_01813]